MSGVVPCPGAEVVPLCPTPAQMRLLRWIAGYAEVMGRMPGFAEMIRGAGYRSKSSVHRMLIGMESRGVIRRLHHAERAIELVHVPAVPRGPDGAPRYFIGLGRIYAEQDGCHGGCNA